MVGKKNNRGGQRKPVWVRDRYGKETYYPDTETAAENLKVCVATVYAALRRGTIISNRYQATRKQGDFSKCQPFDTNDSTMAMQASFERRMKTKAESMAHHATVKVEMPPVKEPKTPEDWEAMRQRAMQPFVCSLTDEDMRRHEEEIRQESIRQFRLEHYQLKK